MLKSGRLCSVWRVGCAGKVWTKIRGGAKHLRIGSRRGHLPRSRRQRLRPGHGQQLLQQIVAGRQGGLRAMTRLVNMQNPRCLRGNDVTLLHYALPDGWPAAIRRCRQCITAHHTSLI